MREGKGKYNVTVPVLFEFQKNPNEKKSTRQKWLEAEMERKEAQLQNHLSTKIKPTEPPRTSTQKLYKIILRREAQRRQKNREASLARNKALS